jgi:hypothetical protein
MWWEYVSNVVRMGISYISHTMLVRMENDRATLENSLTVSYETNMHYACNLAVGAFGHLFQENENLHSHKHLHRNIHSRFICNSFQLETSQCSSVSEWWNKLWCICPVEYSVIKRSKLLVHTGTWMDLIGWCLVKKVIQRVVCWIIPFKCHLWNDKTRAKKKVAVGKGQGQG